MFIMPGINPSLCHSHSAVPVVISDCRNDEFDCGDQAGACVALELVCDEECDCNSCLDEHESHCGEGTLPELFVTVPRTKMPVGALKRYVQNTHLTSVGDLLVCRCCFQLQ